jgi:hypothetical protein
MWATEIFLWYANDIDLVVENADISDKIQVSNR